MAENTLHIGHFSCSETDVVRICFNASLVASSGLITILASYNKINFITTHIFYNTVKSTVNAGSTFTIHMPKEVPRVT